MPPGFESEHHGYYVEPERVDALTNWLQPIHDRFHDSYQKWVAQQQPLCWREAHEALNEYRMELQELKFRSETPDETQYLEERVKQLEPYYSTLRRFQPRETVGRNETVVGLEREVLRLERELRYLSSQANREVTMERELKVRKDDFCDALQRAQSLLTKIVTEIPLLPAENQQEAQRAYNRVQEVIATMQSITDVSPRWQSTSEKIGRPKRAERLDRTLMRSFSVTDNAHALTTPDRLYAIEPIELDPDRFTPQRDLPKN